MSKLIPWSLLAVGAFVLGCSKPSPEEQKKKEEALASAISSAMAGAMPSTATTTNAAAAPGAFVGSCTINDSQICNEFLGGLPLGAEDSCKLLEGVFSRTARCPADKLGKAPLVGICTLRAEGDDRIKKSHSYAVEKTTPKASAESAKAMCDVQSGTFEAVQAAASQAAEAPRQPAAKKK